MISCRNVAIAAFALVGGLQGALAYIDTISPPATVVAGQSVSVTVTTSIYIQNWNDMGIMWGLSPRYLCDGCVGLEIGYTNLLGACAGQEPLGNFTVEVTIPQSQANGTYSLNAAVPFLVGASGETGINFFNSSIEIISE